MHSCQKITRLHRDEANRLEVFEAESAGKQVVIKIYERRTLEEVQQLLKSAVHLCKVSCLLPGPLKSLRVSQCKDTEGYKVEWVMGRRRDKEMEELIQPDLWPDAEAKFEAYDSLPPLYEEWSKVCPVSVLEGKSVLSERPVVVKQYHSGYYGLNNFIMEALLQVKVESLYSCKLLDFFVRPGNRSRLEVGLVMERFERDMGEDIRQRADKGLHYTEQELVHVLIEVSDALMFAKWLGVAHRDIKPSNIFIDNGHYRLGDFGSACEVGDMDSIPDGTLAYLSPEMRSRVLGEEADVNAYQSDVYSLGMTLLHLAKLYVPESISRASRDCDKLKLAVKLEMEGIPYSRTICDLIDQMVRTNPKDRAEIEEIHLNVFFHSLKLSKITETQSLEEAIHRECENLKNCDLVQNVGIVEEKIRRKEYTQAKLLLLKLLVCKKLLKPSERANITNSLGRLYFRLYRFGESEKLLETSIMHKTNIEEMILSDYVIGWMYMCENRQIEARALLKNIIDKLAKLSGENHQLIVEIYNKIGAIYCVEMKWAEAEAIYEQNLQYCQQYGTESKLFADTLNRLGEVYMETGRLNLAETVTRESIEICIRLQGEIHPDIAQYLNQLSAIYFRQGRYESAEALYAKSLETFTPLLGESDLHITRSWEGLAETYFATGRASEAIAIRRQIVDIIIQHFGEENIETARCQYQLARFCEREGEMSEAEQLLTKAVSTWIRLLGEEDSCIAICYEGLGCIFYKQERLNEAELMLEKGLRIWRKVCGGLSENIARCADILGDIYAIQRRFPDAEKRYLESYEIHLTRHGVANPKTLKVINFLLLVYLEEGNIPEADLLLQQLFRIHIQLQKQSSPDLLDISDKLISVYLQTRQAPKAILLLGKCYELCATCFGPTDPHTKRVHDMWLQLSTN